MKVALPFLFSLILLSGILASGTYSSPCDPCGRCRACVCEGWNPSCASCFLCLRSVTFECDRCNGSSDGGNGITVNVTVPPCNCSSSSCCSGSCDGEGETLVKGAPVLVPSGSSSISRADCASSSGQGIAIGGTCVRRIVSGNPVITISESEAQGSEWICEATVGGSGSIILTAIAICL